MARSWPCGQIHEEHSRQREIASAKALKRSTLGMFKEQKKKAV